MAKDYPEHHKLLIAATRIYYVKIWTFDPFPDDKLQAQWAVDSWDTVSNGLPLPDNGVIHYVSDSAFNAPKQWQLVTGTDIMTRSRAETRMLGVF